MENTSTANISKVNVLVLPTVPISRPEGIAWCISFSLLSIFIVVGNLLTIILFVVKKKSSEKKLVFCDQYGFRWSDVRNFGSSTLCSISYQHWLLSAFHTKDELDFGLCVKEFLQTFVVCVTYVCGFDILREVLRYTFPVQTQNKNNERIQHCHFHNVDTFSTMGNRLRLPIIRVFWEVYFFIVRCYFNSHHLQVQLCHLEKV